jgi:hypothetical protein
VSASIDLEPMRTLATRPSESRSTLRWPGCTPSRRANLAASNVYGPQLWCGEIESYGSGTERRYGMLPAFGQTSWMSAVRPPELEKKNVVATRPCQVRTLPAVRLTAKSMPGVS